MWRQQSPDRRALARTSGVPIAAQGLPHTNPTACNAVQPLVGACRQQYQPPSCCAPTSLSQKIASKDCRASRLTPACDSCARRWRCEPLHSAKLLRHAVVHVHPAPCHRTDWPQSAVHPCCKAVRHRRHSTLEWDVPHSWLTAPSLRSMCSCSQAACSCSLLHLLCLPCASVPQPPQPGFIPNSPPWWGCMHSPVLHVQQWPARH